MYRIRQGFPCELNYSGSTNTTVILVFQGLIHQLLSNNLFNAGNFDKRISYNHIQRYDSMIRAVSNFLNKLRR